MYKAMVIGTAVAILIGVAVTPVAGAGARQGATQAPDLVQPSAQGAAQTPIVLRRDGDRAVPFDPVIGAARPGAPGDNGFRWGDALIGALGTLGLIALASVALLLITRTRPARRLARRPAQGALG